MLTQFATPNRCSNVRSFTLAIFLLSLFSATILIQGCAVVAVGAAAGGAMIAHDRRNTQTLLSDNQLEIKGVDAIYQEKQLQKTLHGNITSYNGVLLFTGEVLSNELRDKAVDIVRNIEGVKRVHNELLVADLASFQSRSRDTWLTSKVKTQLALAQGVDPLLIKVVVERQTVYLMGLLTAREAELAVDVARNVEGVQKVVTLFEVYTPPDRSTPNTKTSPSQPKKQ